MENSKKQNEIKRIRIKELRQRIDGYDMIMLDTINTRFFYVKEIGKLKKELGSPIVDKTRFENMVNDRIDKYCKNKINHLSEDFIRKLYDLIHEESIKIQQ